VKIVHIIARLNVGGAALSVLELAAGQQKNGHEVIVVAGQIPPGEASMEHLAGELGVNYRRLPALQREVSPRADIAAVRALWQLIRSERPDVVHTHTSKAGTTGRLAARFAGDAQPRAIVHSYHGHVLTGYFGPRRETVYRAIERALATISDRLIAVSEAVRDDLVGLGVAPATKFTVVPYGFDLDRRLTGDGSRRNELAADDAFVIGWAGRFAAVKQPLDLVRTAAKVDRSVLVLAGDGELRPDVAALAGTLGIADRVRFLGYIDDIGDWYAAFDAFLLTSVNEGAPVVAIEAQAAGVPVVATDAGGTRTVVDDGETGFLVPVGDVASLADRLEKLRDDPALRRRLGDEGRTRMRERFSTKRMVDDVERVYAEILAR
jgi:glycosyltransferase involved in cell wall biosynthesis